MTLAHFSVSSPMNFPNSDAGAVLDDDRLTETLLQPLRDHAGEKVRRWPMPRSRPGLPIWAARRRSSRREKFPMR